MNHRKPFVRICALFVVAVCLGGCHSYDVVTEIRPYSPGKISVVTSKLYVNYFWGTVSVDNARTRVVDVGEPGR